MDRCQAGPLGEGGASTAGLEIGVLHYGEGRRLLSSDLGAVPVARDAHLLVHVVFEADQVIDGVAL